MGIYFIYYIIITILAVLLTRYIFCFSIHPGQIPDRAKKISEQWIFYAFASSLLLILIIGFRSEFNGLDLHNSLGTGYFYYYEKINEDSILEILQNFGKRRYANFEIGFCLFCKVIGTICSNQQILLFASAVLSVIPVAYFISKNSKNVWLSIVIYMAMPFFGPAYFSAIRQGIAIGLAVLSYEFIKRKKLVKFVIIILIASTFHSSAIVVLAAYPMYHFRLDKNSALVGGVSALILIFLLKEPLFLVLARTLDEDAVIVKNASVNLFILLTLMYAICVVFSKRQENRGLQNIFWLACAAQAFSGISNMAGRVAWYFMPCLIILIPNIATDMSIKEKQIRKSLGWIIGILACIVGLYFLRYDMVAAAYPYEPFWIQK